MGKRDLVKLVRGKDLDIEELEIAIREALKKYEARLKPYRTDNSLSYEDLHELRY